MELRTTEEKINELLATYEGTRGSSILQPEQKGLLPSTPTELLAAGKTGASKATIVINDEDDLVGSLRKTEAALEELIPRVEKFRKRLFEIDPVTEKPRYGPKSQTRVRLLVAKHYFLCSQYNVSFPEQCKQQKQQIDQYRKQQLELQEQRQEQRRQEHLKQEELRKKSEEEQNDEQQQTSAEEKEDAVTIDENINPDGSIIITHSINASENDDMKMTPACTEASPASLLFAELQQQYKLKQEEQQRQQVSKETSRLKEEEEKRRREAEEQARQKALEALQAAGQAAEEEARTQRLHQEAEEVRLRRRAQDEARKQAERDWLNGIKKGAEGVKHYLDILLLRPVSQPQGEKKQEIDPDRFIALQALFTLFEQIQKNPEEINNRKFKMSNPNFHRDIGRHEGGIELLVAAGFRPTVLPATNTTVVNDSGSEAKNENEEGQEEQPDIAFLISKEPNLEHDMDGWMTWFDLNKATLEILQTELQKVEGSKRSRR